jgi:hypothetical protein
MIDKDKLNHAFRQMRHAGLVARQNFSCCGSCAGYELTTDIVAMPAKKRANVKGVCFYHRQDAERLNRGGDLYLGFGPVDSTEHGQIGLETVQVGRLVVRALELAGLGYEWDGTASQCILVKA